MMEEHLYSVLSAALSCPVKWGYFSDGESIPRVTLTQTSGRRDRTYRTKGLKRGSVQIDCWGLSYGQVKSVSDDVNAALELYQGGPILSANLSATRGGGDGGSGSQKVHRISLTYALTWRD